MEQLRVLVIDDSATIRALIEAIVAGQPGCRVVGVAADAEVARRLLEEVEPNVITLDLAMPGIGGLGFLEELGSRRHAPVVVISSATPKGSDEEKAVLKRGAAACFDKARVVDDAAGLLRLLGRVVRNSRRSPA